MYVYIYIYIYIYMRGRGRRQKLGAPARTRACFGPASGLLRACFGPASGLLRGQRRLRGIPGPQRQLPGGHTEVLRRPSE